jgi:hypothetical protein
MKTIHEMLPMQSAYVPTSRAEEQAAASLAAMEPRERSDYDTAKAVREREDEADRRRRARLAGELDRLRRV